MSLSNGKITAPVSIDDVKNVLGEYNTNDLATLCKSTNINMWAKYKPTSYAAPFPDDWYKAGDGNYGLNITDSNRVNSAAELVAEYAKDNNGYSNIYKRPSGGSSSPYRLGDFRGYNHNANPELSDYLVNNSLTRESAHTLSVSLNPVTSDGDQISYSQFSAWSGYRFGYVIMSGSSLATIVTASNTINNGDYVVTLPANRLAVGSYKVYPMFCSADYSSSSTLQQMSLYAIPNLGGGKNLEIISQTSVVRAYFETISAVTLGTNISVTLKTKSSAPALSVTVYCVYQTNPSAGQTMVSGETYKTADIASGDTTFVKFSGLTSGKSYTIYILCKGEWIAKGLVPISKVL